MNIVFIIHFKLLIFIFYLIQRIGCSFRSQVIAATCLAGSIIVTSVVQPYLDVFTRWNHVKMEHGSEVRPTERINRIANSVFQKLEVPEKVKNNIDFFLTKNAEAVALGSLRDAINGKENNGYAFIGLPYFCIYEEPVDIPLEHLKFASPLFPYTPFSPEGQRRLSLMCLSDRALEFLVAREVVSLLGSSGLARCRQSTSSPCASLPIFLPPRQTSQVATASLLGVLYASYQICFGLNHFLGLRHACPHRVRGLIFTGVTAFSLLVHRQLLAAWRYSTALTLDAAVGRAEGDLRVGGVEYYAWKGAWNAFWARMLEPCQRAMAALREATRHSLSGGQDKAMPQEERYRIQRILCDRSTDSGPDDYFVPAAVEQCEQLSGGRLEGCRLRLDDVCAAYVTAYRLPGYRTSSDGGDEVFAADGEVLRFNITGLLAFGALPRWLAWLFRATLVHPATCSRRRDALLNLSPPPSHSSPDY